MPPVRLLVTLLLLSALVACTGEAVDPVAGDASTPSGSEAVDADSSPSAGPEAATAAPDPAEEESDEEAAVIADVGEDLQGFARPGTALPPEPDLRDAIRLEVGVRLQDVVDASPVGSTFLLASGLHRTQALTLRDGDTLVGEPGAVMDGSILLEDLVPDGDRWVSSGRTEDPAPHGVMLEGWDNEANPHDLFVDGVRQRHVLTGADVGPGTYWFDYDNDQLVMGTDPTGKDVELAVVQVGIAGPGTSDVTVRGVELRHYAVWAQQGAISAADTHDWTLVAVRAVDNHGAGIRLGSGTEVHGCWAEGNGQMGVIGWHQEADDRPMVVSGCHIESNGVLGFDWTWEAGATKFIDTHGLDFRNNAVLDNAGPGIWFDTMNTDATIVGNEISGNAINGVFYELSSGALVEDNVITDNGAEGGALAAGIFVANSPGVTVRNNTLSGNTNEVVGVQSHHGDEIDIPRLVEDLQVTGNHITLTTGFVGLSVTTDQTFLYEEGNNRFADNDYVLDGCDPCFIWGDFMELGEWQAVGNDLEATFTTVGD
jgi:hypothetical protein